MLEIVRQLIEKHTLFSKGDTLIIGVSGGSDSMALLHMLTQLKDPMNLTIVAAHMNYSLRGEDSEKDSAFVKHICDDWNVTFEGRKIALSRNKSRDMSTQMAAREERFSFFSELAARYEAHALCLAHHGDDQIETMLLRLMHGATPQSVSGLHRKRTLNGLLTVRPLLHMSKDDVLAYCLNEHVPFREDQSNYTRHYVRNRLRHDVIPLLKQENPQLQKQFQAFSDALQDDGLVLDRLASRCVDRYFSGEGHMLFLKSVESFLDEEHAIQQRALKQSLHSHFKLTDRLSTERVMKCLHWLEHGSGMFQLGQGIIAIREYEAVRIYHHDEFMQENLSHRQVITRPGTWVLRNGALLQMKNESACLTVPKKQQYSVRLSADDFPLVIRERRPGDTLYISGVGTKKVTRVMVDEKIPKALRASWPLLVTNRGEILWVIGAGKGDLKDREERQDQYYFTYGMGKQEAEIHDER
ncbi:tRNA lysidine(34) synthetase TilS [Aureibacillus halotolerans]|uniref:tRNA(Ile)-lysidine synthase n=1 Tax=Aureibacillus halotolerans TaxID=1508390 RepID=A0A4R6TSQ4_9BACI|nr:tRNA lysidine(34) synthetase TilS [Aureibacillus halotolerans]TDQ34213.1 tRNA(Ile)-lysidine synthase [Aureibacillus halotolerans]